MVAFKLDIARDEEVEHPVSVVVEEGGRTPPAFIPEPRAVGRVRKDASSVVDEETVRTEVGDIEVGVAVCVDVADGDAHAVPAVSEARRSGGVLEAPVRPLQEERVLRSASRARRAVSVSMTVDEIEVQVAV